LASRPPAPAAPGHAGQDVRTFQAQLNRRDWPIRGGCRWRDRSFRRVALDQIRHL